MRRRVALALVAAVLAAAHAGCRSAGGPPPPQQPVGPKGLWHPLRKGETLWHLSQRYEVPVETIRHANRIEDVRALAIGQRVWIPGGGEAPPEVAAAAPGFRPGPRERATDGDWGEACHEVAQVDGLAFEWPVLGRLSSPYGPRRGRLHDGIDLLAERGTPVYAAESGRVVYSDDGLGDYGRVVIVEHPGRWATVYAHNDRNLVREGDAVAKGDPIARVGRTGNASAPHVHFEIRRSNRPRDPLSCLP